MNEIIELEKWLSEEVNKIKSASIIGNSVVEHCDEDSKNNLIKEYERRKKELEDKSLILSYKELRAKEYPPIQDQLDMIYWDRVKGTKNWEKAITAVKTKFPIKV